MKVKRQSRRHEVSGLMRVVRHWPMADAQIGCPLYGSHLEVSLSSQRYRVIDIGSEGASSALKRSALKRGMAQQNVTGS